MKKHRKLIIILFIINGLFINSLNGQNDLLKKNNFIEPQIFHNHIEKIINLRKIKKEISVRDMFDDINYFISLGDNRFFSIYQLDMALSRKDYKIWYLTTANLFFRMEKKYLRLLNIKRYSNSILYELITQTDGKELYCMIEFSLNTGNEEIINQKISRVRTVKLDWL